MNMETMEGTNMEIKQSQKSIEAPPPEFPLTSNEPNSGSIPFSPYEKRRKRVRQ